jgi:hypothetical protein
MHYDDGITAQQTCTQIALCIKPYKVGRAIAQAVSRWLPIAAARIQTRV